jgi:hypothetical protein
MTPSTPGLTIAPRCQQCGVEIVQTEHGWLHTTTPADGGTDACTHQVRPADAARAPTAHRRHPGRPLAN